MNIDLGKIFQTTITLFWDLRIFWGILLGISLIKILFNLLESIIKRNTNKKRFKKGEAYRDNIKLLAWVRTLSDQEFEEYIARVFSKLGYKTEVVGAKYSKTQGDGGIDIVAEKDGIKHYIQCKKYSNKNTVEVGEIRDFYGAITGLLSDGKNFFVTTGKFSFPAEQYADDKPIELVNSSKLIALIRMTEDDIN